MPKALVIAEKPSVAADLARALGKSQEERAFRATNLSLPRPRPSSRTMPARRDGQEARQVELNLPISPFRPQAYREDASASI